MSGDPATAAIPAHWTLEPLCDLGTWVGGGTPSKRNPQFWEGGTIPWISPKDMKESVLSGTEDMITEAALEGSAAKRFEAESLAIVVRSGILEHTLPIAFVPFAAAANQDMRVLTPRPELNRRWLLYALQGHSDEIRRVCSKQGMTVASIEVPRMMEYVIAVPPQDQQGAMAKWVDGRLEAVNAGLQALRSAQRQADQLTRSILLRAARGDVRFEV